MITNIPMELLRTFTVIADCCSFSRAADIVGRTQSAVSMQVKRLEEIVEKPLLKRDSRNIKLTANITKQATDFQTSFGESGTLSNVP